MKHQQVKTLRRCNEQRSARQVLQELGQDVKQANILQKCLTGDING
jgi:hypothetical protein